MVTSRAVVGFVGDEQARIAGQRHGDHHALAHAAAHLVRVVVDAGCGIGDLHQPEHLHGLVLRLPPRDLLVEADGLGNLVADGEHRVQRGHGLLEHHGDLVAADPPHLLVLQLEQVLSAVEDLAVRHPSGRRRDQPHDGEGRHALAATRLAHEPQSLARLDGEVQPVHRRKLAVGGHERSVEILDFEQCRHGARSLPAKQALSSPQARTVPKNGRGANDIRA